MKVAKVSKYFYVFALNQKSIASATVFWLSAIFFYIKVGYYLLHALLLHLQTYRLFCSPDGTKPAAKKGVGTRMVVISPFTGVYHSAVALGARCLVVLVGRKNMCPDVVILLVTELV